MQNISFTKNQMVGITELQRNAKAVSSKTKDNDIVILKNNSPCAVMMNFERYEKLIEQAEQAEIYAMLSQRKDNKKWLTTKEVLGDLSSLTKGHGKVGKGLAGELGGSSGVDRG